MITYKTRIDINGAKTMAADLVFTSGDTHAYRLCFFFYDGNEMYDTTGCRLTVKAKRADGVVVTDSGTIEDGNCYYDVKSDIYAVPGEVYFEIALSASAEDSYITTKEICFEVREGFGDGDLTATNTTPILNTLLAAADKAESTAKQTAETADAAAESLQNATEATKSANGAAQKADAAADKAVEAAQSAQTAKQETESATLAANGAAAAANTAATAANAAAARITTPLKAENISYTPTSSHLTAETVQTALDELSQKLYAVAGMSELTWANVQKLVRSGLAPQVFSVGDQLICNHTKFGELVWDIIDFDHDVPTDTSRTHSLSLQLHNPVESIMFDAAEAFYYAENGLAAGTYYTTLPAGYEEANGGGKSYYFTLPSAVPAGGQLRFGWSINKNAAEAKIVPYADRYTRQETYISVTEGTEGTELAFSNYVRPARFGSNRWKESSVRQWLNSAAAANSWWEPQSSFDRPTPDVGKPGFLNGLDADFLAVIGTVTKRTVKNNEIGGGYEDLTEKIFLPSRSEVFGGNTLDNITYTEEGAPYSYYDTGRSALAKPSVGADTNRIHYKASGTATGFWLRSGTPHNSMAGNAVLSDGGIGYGTYAYNLFPVAPVCNII